MKIKPPRLGEMIRVRYKDHGSRWRLDYSEAMDGTPILVSRGRFIGCKDGIWYVESDNVEDKPGDHTVHMSVIIASCIIEVKKFGFDDSPLPIDLEDILKSRS